MEEDDSGLITCATYTHARRHPMVLGHIGGWKPPFQLTLPQVGVILVSYWLEIQTWKYWGSILPRTLAIIIAVAVPCVLAWVLRRTRIEGRSLPRFALSWLMAMYTPRNGQVKGRPYRHAGPAVPGAASIYVAPGEE
jgi:hypothetical protein